MGILSTVGSTIEESRTPFWLYDPFMLEIVDLKNSAHGLYNLPIEQGTAKSLANFHKVPSPQENGPDTEAGSTTEDWRLINEQGRKLSVRVISILLVTMKSSKEEKDISCIYEFGVNSYIGKPANFKKFIVSVSDVGYYWVLLNQPINNN